MRQKIISIGAGCAMLGYLAGLGTGVYNAHLTRGDEQLMQDNRRCFEDEVVMWDGRAHTICEPLDNLQQQQFDAAWNAAIECLYTNGRITTWGCTAD